MKRLLTAIALAGIVAATTSAAEARPRHHHHHYHARAHHVRHAAPQQSLFQRSTPQQEPSFADSFQSGFQGGFSAGSGVVSRARQFIGQTAGQVGVRSTLWCSAFLRKITGASGVDDTALSWERHHHIAPQVGAVVTMGRRGGGHVGVVSGFDKSGNPIVISGNGGGHRVTEHVYPRNRIRAWVSAT